MLTTNSFFVMKRLQQNGYEIEVKLQKENIVDLYSINKNLKKNEREKTTTTNKQMIKCMTTKSNFYWR